MEQEAQPQIPKTERRLSPLEIIRATREKKVKEIAEDKARLSRIAQVAKNKDFMDAMHDFVDIADSLVNEHLRARKFEEAFGQLMIKESLVAVVELIEQANVSTEEQQPRANEGSHGMKR